MGQEHVEHVLQELEIRSQASIYKLIPITHMLEVTDSGSSDLKNHDFNMKVRLQFQ